MYTQVFVQFFILQAQAKAKYTNDKTRNTGKKECPDKKNRTIIDPNGANTTVTIIQRKNTTNQKVIGFVFPSITSNFTSEDTEQTLTLSH